MLKRAIGPVLIMVLGICVSPAPAWAEEKPPEAPETSIADHDAKSRVVHLFLLSIVFR